MMLFGNDEIPNHSGRSVIRDGRSHSPVDNNIFFFGPHSLFQPGSLFISLLNDNPRRMRPIWDSQSRTILFAINLSL